MANPAVLAHSCAFSVARHVTAHGVYVITIKHHIHQVQMCIILCRLFCLEPFRAMPHPDFVPLCTIFGAHYSSINLLLME